MAHTESGGAVSLAPLRPCSHPHCGALTRGGKCATHRRLADEARGSALARGYTPEWAAYSRAWLARFPFCGMRRDGLFHSEHSLCTARGERVRAAVTDHITPLREGGALLDPANHQSLCTSCNVRKEKGKTRWR
jgi:5-methylcytosine-specific restriction protein A